MVEHRSPKPGAAGSSPATPAIILDEGKFKLDNKKISPALFVRQVRQEISKVTWPERKDLIISSVIVIVLIFLFSLFFLLTDQVISFTIKKIISFGV